MSVRDKIADAIDDHEGENTCYVLADLVLTTIKANVPELEWSDRNAVLWASGDYQIVNEGELGWGVCHLFCTMGYYPTFEAAQAAAQAHHVERLMKGLGL